MYQLTLEDLRLNIQSAIDFALDNYPEADAPEGFEWRMIVTMDEPTDNPTYTGRWVLEPCK